MPIKEWNNKAKSKKKKVKVSKKKVKPPKPTQEGFKHEWCRCMEAHRTVKRTVKKCKCGWSKEHEHCIKCGGTTSVG